MSGGRAEARRRKILEQGQDRLKHITLSLNSTSSGVSRSLDFSGEDLDRQSSQKPTPAASGGAQVVEKAHAQIHHPF